MGNSVDYCSRVAPRKPVTDKSTERCQANDYSPNNSKNNLHCAVSSMRGWRPTMEDQHIQQLHLSEELMDHSLFAVFDGHGGGLTSSFLEHTFASVLLKHLQTYTSLPKRGRKSRANAGGVKLLKAALTRTFLELDRDLESLQQKVTKTVAQRHAEQQQALIESDPNNHVSNSNDYTLLPMERSGSTAVVVLLTPTHIVTANAGDSRAILRRSGRVLPLSFDHKPSDLGERRRILAGGGYVKNKRVDGDLAVSRAFGDYTYKCNNRVIVNPDFTVYPRDSKSDEFLVLACDGIWDVASNKECSEYVQNMLSAGVADLGEICEDALDLCLRRKSRDNMTIMVVALPAMKVDQSSRALLNNTLYRTRRQFQSLDSTFETVKDACESATKDMTHKLLNQIEVAVI